MFMEELSFRYYWKVSCGVRFLIRQISVLLDKIYFQELTLMLGCSKKESSFHALMTHLILHVTHATYIAFMLLMLLSGVNVTI